jgi:hypothetical protein
MNLLYLRGARSHVIRKEKKLKELSVDAAAQKIFTPDEIFCTFPPLLPPFFLALSLRRQQQPRIFCITMVLKCVIK